MATFSELLQTFRNFRDEIFNSSAPKGSIDPVETNTTFEKLASAVEAHANDADLHSGNNAMPESIKGGILVKGDEVWEALPENGQHKVPLMGANSVLGWAYMLTHISLAFEADGYAYPAIDTTTGTPVLHVFGKNIKVYDRQKNKVVYLAYSSNKTFEISMPVNTVEAYSSVYLVCSIAALHAAASGTNIALSVVDELTADHLVLLENKSGSGTYTSQASGLLRNLFAQYQTSQQGATTVTVTDSIATINTAKFDKASGLFYIAHNASFTINTINSYLVGNGRIIIYNSGDGAITVTFSTNFAGKAISILAGKRKIFDYVRLGVSSVLNVEEVLNELPATSANPYDLGFAMSDEDSDLKFGDQAQREVTRAQTLESITFYVNVAPTDSSVICEVYKNATLIATITLPPGSKSVTVANTTSFAVGDRIKGIITQYGLTIAGAGAKLEPKTNLS